MLSLSIPITIVQILVNIILTKIRHRFYTQTGAELFAVLTMLTLSRLLDWRAKLGSKAV